MNLQPFINQCPLCSKPLENSLSKITGGKNSRACLTCKIEIGLSTTYETLYQTLVCWIRKDFNPSINNRNCFYWVDEKSGFSHHVFYASDGLTYRFNQNMDIPFGITEKTLLTMINFS